MEPEGIVWENVDWVRVAENRVLLEPVDKTVVKLLCNIRKAENEGIT